MNKIYCLLCPENCLITIVKSGAGQLIEGNNCQKGEEFVNAEMTDPVRTITTTVRTRFPDVPVISVRSAYDIPKDKLSAAMSEINKIVVDIEYGCGDILINDVAETGVPVIVTSNALLQLGAELENNNDKLSSISSSSPRESKYGIIGDDVRNSESDGVVDSLGEDHVGGFIGAAGEAVGVEDEDEAAGGAADAEDDGPRARPHIRRGT